MSPRRVALLAVVVAALVLAGCSAADGAGPSPETTAGSAEAQALAADAADAMAAVDTYRVTANVTRAQTHNARRVVTRVNSTGTFDRTDRAVRLTRRTSQRGTTITEDVYLVNDSVYRHSRAYESRVGSAWVTADVENSSGLWNRLDTLRRQRYLLTNATVSLAGTETVAGRETRVLRVRGNESALEDVLSSGLGQQSDEVSVNVTDVSFTVYVDADADLPVRSVGVVNSTVTANGRSVRFHEEVRLSFAGYGDDVSVTLPENASTAVSLDDRTEG